MLLRAEGRLCACLRSEQPMEMEVEARSPESRLGLAAFMNKDHANPHQSNTASPLDDKHLLAHPIYRLVILP